MPTRKTRLTTGDLILNSPFEEPDAFWDYDRSSMLFTQMSGRRQAGYVVATPNAQGFDDPGVFVPLPLVNQLRPRVQAWRAAGYPGVTGVTRRLLEHWYDPDQREGRRFFFCQLEAIETLIWLTESAPAQTQGHRRENRRGESVAVAAQRLDHTISASWRRPGGRGRRFRGGRACRGRTC